MASGIRRRRNISAFEALLPPDALGRAKVGYALDLLREGLGPFVEQKIGVSRLDEAASLGNEAVRDRLDKFRVNDESRNKYNWPEKRFREWDAALLLRLLDWLLGSVPDMFERTEQGYVGQLQGVRIDWAHQKPFSADDTDWALETAGLFLRVIEADTQAEAVDRIREEAPLPPDALPRAKVGYALDLLREGLGPFVERKIGVDRLDQDKSLAGFDVEDELKEKRFREWDTPNLFNLMRFRGRKQFRGQYQFRRELGYVQELQDIRLDWAHQRPFSAADTGRALSLARRFLGTVGASTQVEALDRIREGASPAPSPQPSPWTEPKPQPPPPPKMREGPMPSAPAWSAAYPGEWTKPRRRPAPSAQPSPTPEPKPQPPPQKKKRSVIYPFLVLVLGTGLVVWGGDVVEEWLDVKPPGSPGMPPGSPSVSDRTPPPPPHQRPLWPRGKDTPLHGAAIGGDLAAVKKLIAAGADLEARNKKYGRTPLHLAANLNANPAVVKALIEAGADLEARDKELGSTPLHVAAALNANPAVVEALLAAGANLEARGGKYGRTPLHTAAAQSANPAVVEALLAAGADLEARNKKYGRTPLHLAANLNANPAVAKALIEAGADLEARDKELGSTPLHVAAALNANPAVVKALLAAGANLEARDKDGRTPLHTAAAQSANPAVVEALLAAGADLEARNKKYGRTPLHLAANLNANPAVVKALIEAGADLEARDKELGSTPLHVAAALNANPAVVEALLKAGADPKARNKAGRSPLGYAEDNKALKGTDAYRRLNEAWFKE